MIRKILFGFLWFVVIFVVSYLIGGFIYAVATGVAASGSFQAGRTAGIAFRQTYGNYFLIGALVLAIIGSAAGLLPGTKKKPRKRNLIKEIK